MIRIVFLQTRDMLKRKESLLAFCILLILVLWNYIRNVFAFQGTDVIAMYHPMKLLLLSYNMTCYNADLTILFIQLFPILVVCPAGFALAKEYQIGESIYVSARLGNDRYKMSKFMAVFATTFIIFTVPFLIEMILNCLAFPLVATGDLSNWDAYDISYLNSVNNYIAPQFYREAPYLYSFMCVVLFGVFSGMLGVFTSVISAVYKVKYNIFLFLPVYVFLNMFSMLSREKEKSLRWDDFMLLFNEVEKNTYVFMGIWIIFLVILAIGIIHTRKKDCL